MQNRFLNTPFTSTFKGKFVKQHLSSLLMDNEQFTHLELGDKRLTLWDKVELIYAFQLTKDLILNLGNLEHTSDWDPYLRIGLKDGTYVETRNGYYSFNLNGFPWDEVGVDIEDEINTLFLCSPEEDELELMREDGEELWETNIPIKDIISIDLLR